MATDRKREELSQETTLEEQELEQSGALTEAGSEGEASSEQPESAETLQGEGAETSEATKEETEAPPQEDTEAPQEAQEESQSPIAVLKVRGTEIPIYNKEDLVRYAQMGVDYSLKMHEFRQWRHILETALTNPTIKTLIDKALQGEDITKYVSFGQPKSSSEPTTTESTFTTEETTSTEVKPDIVEKTIEQIVQQKIQPFLTDMERKMFIQQIRASDPKYADIVFSIMALKAQDPNTPPGLKMAMDNDPATFMAVYKEIRDQLIAMEQAQKKQQAQKKVSKPKPKATPPKVESGKSSPTLQERMLEEAKSIWDMPSDKFEELVRKAKGFV